MACDLGLAIHIIVPETATREYIISFETQINHLSLNFDYCFVEAILMFTNIVWRLYSGILMTLACSHQAHLIKL